MASQSQPQFRSFLPSTAHNNNTTNTNNDDKKKYTSPSQTPDSQHQDPVPDSATCSGDSKAEKRETDDMAELGYLYLDECQIFFPSSSFTSPSPSFFAENQWINLKLIDENDDDSSLFADNKGDGTFCCPQCHLVCYYSIDERSFVISGNKQEFNGTLQERNCICQNCKRRKRDDSILLLELARSCHTNQHIVIKKIQVCFLSASFCKEQDKKDEDNHHRNKKNYISKTCRLYISFSIPEFTTKGKQKRRRFITTSPKVLPSCTQLLLSIMRSDWDVLSLGKSCEKQNNKHTFFPTKLSLNQVYQQIGGATSLLMKDEEEKNEKRQHSTLNNLQQLPREVLIYKIAPFLRALSLHNWRCSSKYFSSSLCGTIPGLSLQLYKHQINSLQWMKGREAHQFSEHDLFLAPSKNLLCGDDSDAHRAASGGASVLLTNRRTGERIHICQSSLTEIAPPKADDPLSRQMARGGLLCDDPGLGKTITVLSLILSTLGLSTVAGTSIQQKKIEPKDILTPNLVVVNDDSDDIDLCANNRNLDDVIFDEYWKESLPKEYQTQSLLRILNNLQKSTPNADYFVWPMDTSVIKDSLHCVKEPICFRDIKDLISKQKEKEGNKYKESFQTFEQDVLRIFSNVKSKNAPGSTIHQAAIQVEEIFQNIVKDFRQEQIKIAKKAFRRANSQPNSTVAALISSQKKLLLLKSLVPSSATLLVVPSVLLEHWQDQIRSHINLKYCCPTKKIPILFTYTGTHACMKQMSGIVHSCLVKKTHYAFLFLDKSSTKELPSPEFLAMFQIVITTNQRFTNEWKNGSFEDELKHQSGDNTYHYCELYYLPENNNKEACCPLLKVHWLRMIVDEGHSMARQKVNSAICFASWIMAERRWAMTGTPTRLTLTQNGLRNILNLMNFLKHGYFERKKGGDASFSTNIQKSWNQGNLAGFFRLTSLLKMVMIRHTKADIQELLPPLYKTQLLPMSEMEVTTYNTLVCAIQSNLLITSMEGSRTSGKQDSLLHQSQAKHAKKALENVRLVCAGGTKVLPTLSSDFFTEFMNDFQACDPLPHKLNEMKQYLHRAVTGQLSPCACCGILLSTLLVFPCGDLVCTECVSPSSQNCIVCNQTFDVDLFQRLQPGMDYQWLHNVEEESKQGGTVHPSMIHQQQRQRTRKPGDGHICEYSPKFATGECQLCWKRHDDCKFFADKEKCEICHLPKEECPPSETKSAYVIDKLIQLYKNRQVKYPYERKKRPLKVIVFSQFRKVLNMTGDRLLRRFGGGCVAEYWGSFRKKELHKFTVEKDCFCMLLGKDGSEGLDLSFVTHIFFMEQVWDKSLEQQAVARAWRMGAKGSVEVETLVAQTSVEETMNRLEQEFSSSASIGQQEESSSSSSSSAKEYQRAKLQHLLKGLSLIANHHVMSFGSGNDSNKRDESVIQQQQVVTAEDHNYSKKRKARDDDIREQLPSDGLQARPTRRVRFELV